MSSTVVESEVIGIDLGGTAIKLGQFHKDGTCLQSLSVATPQPATQIAVVEAMADAVVQLTPKKDGIAAIGVGTPGPADAAGQLPKSRLTWQAGAMFP